MPDEYAKFSPSALADWVLQSLRLSGRTVYVFNGGDLKPLRVVLGGLGDEEPTTLRVYVWNATHGGGAARAADEYRIQLTRPMPENVAGQSTVVLGWSAKHNVFVAWDSKVHSKRSSHSPSLQVREDTLTAAQHNGLAAGTRASDDVVIAFRPEMLATYCLNAKELHDNAEGDIVNVLNSIPDLVGSQPESASFEVARRKVVRVVQSNHRAWDFSSRVMAAYEGRCAVCGVQLSLTEAAHIVPVAWPGSSDVTSNGLSLCRNHHRAYDDSMLSVRSDYTVEISQTRGNALLESGLQGGWDALMAYNEKLLAVIPALEEDRPKPAFLDQGRIARNWRS